MGADAQAATPLEVLARETAELARRCAVQENILYRLWPNKKGMFIAAIEYVYDLSTEKWEDLLEGDWGDADDSPVVDDQGETHQGQHQD